VSPDTIDASPVVTAIIRYMELGRRWRGTVGGLLEELNRLKPDHQATDFWPRSAKGLVEAIRRYSPALAQLGIRAEVEPVRRRDGVWCELAADRKDIFFAGEEAGNNVHQVHQIHPTPPAMHVVNMVNVRSGGFGAEKNIPTPSRDVRPAKVGTDDLEAEFL